MVRRILTFSGYLGLTLLVLGVTFALVAYGKDYTYDFSTNSIIQKGHVILNSAPGGVRVVADGKELKKKTPYQAAFKVGDHTFRLDKDGFWPWQKTFRVVAGQVNLARYVILVPKTPASKVLDSRPTGLLAQSISKDHRHLAYITAGVDSALYTHDLGNAKPAKLYTPKVATPTSGAEALTGVIWSDDASHLLVVSTIDGKAVHQLAAADGGAPENLTARYGYDLTGMQFSATNWRQMYWISPEGLRRLDVGDQSVSAVLAERVSQFWVQSDRILYVQQTTLGRSLWSLDNRGRRQELIQVLPESTSYSVAYEVYRGEPTLAVVPSGTGSGTVYTGIFGSTPVAQTVAQGVVAARFSPEGRFLAFSGPNKIVTYDLELSQVEGVPVVYAITDQPGQLNGLTWFDNFHLLTTRDGRLFWSEFDGANRIDLGSAAGAFPAYGTSDFKSVVTFQPEGAVTQPATRIVQLEIKP